MEKKNPYYSFVVSRKDYIALMYLLKNKNDGTWSFINSTKKHICPCRFSSPEEAVEDLKKRQERGEIRAFVEV